MRLDLHLMGTSLPVGDHRVHQKLHSLVCRASGNDPPG